MTADSPDLAVAKRLLDTAKQAGFAFQRIAPEIYLAGFAEPDSCSAIRRRRFSLIVPSGMPVAARVRGDALTVLHTVIVDWEV